MSGLTWAHLGELAACVGRLDLEHLPELLACRDLDSSNGKAWHLAIQTMIVNAAEKSGQAFASEHDVHFAPEKCHDKTAWQRAVCLLSQARKDACFLAWATLDPFEHQPQLHLASDQAVDQIVGLMFSMRHSERVHVTDPKSVSFDATSSTSLSQRCSARLRSPTRWPSASSRPAYAASMRSSQLLTHAVGGRRGAR